MKQRYDIHPAAEAFPMMDQRRYEELRDDIAEHGLRVPLTLADGLLLDGRNRYKACRELDIQPATESFGGDPWSYVWSLNGTRRDLVDEQRYLIWKHCTEHSAAFQAKLRKIQREANERRRAAAKEQHAVSKPYAGEKMVVVQSEQPPSTAQANSRQTKSQAANVKSATVARGDALANNRPDLAEKVRQGELRPAEAHRQMRRDAVADKVAKLPDDQFRVFYADPPWSYSDKQSGSISNSYGAAEKHYPSMKTGELCDMAIPERAAKDAVLFLWATAPLLLDGLRVLESWGFRYKTHFVWDKVRHNMGHYNSVRHELLLIGTKGSCTPDVSKLFDSVQSIERTKKHSEKPEQFRSIIETLYPHGKRIELFARTQSPGWERWGNEA